MTPAGASTSLTSRINGKAIHTPRRVFSDVFVTTIIDPHCENSRMASMTGPGFGVKCKLVNIYIHLVVRLVYLVTTYTY